MSCRGKSVLEVRESTAKYVILDPVMSVTKRPECRPRIRNRHAANFCVPALDTHERIAGKKQRVFKSCTYGLVQPNLFVDSLHLVIRPQNRSQSLFQEVAQTIYFCKSKHGDRDDIIHCYEVGCYEETEELTGLARNLKSR